MMTKRFPDIYQQLPPEARRQLCRIAEEVLAASPERRFVADHEVESEQQAVLRMLNYYTSRFCEGNARNKEFDGGYI